MTKKRASISVREKHLEVDYSVSYEGDVEEWSVVDTTLESTLTEEDCMWIDAQLYEIESGEPLYPSPTLKSSG